MAKIVREGRWGEGRPKRVRGAGGRRAGGGRERSTGDTCSDVRGLAGRVGRGRDGTRRGGWEGERYCESSRGARIS